MSTSSYGDPLKPYTSRPLLFHNPATETSPERAIIQYARRGFTGFLNLPRSEDIPPITESQAEALDALHFLADRFRLTLDFQKGDVQYVNNRSIFHARDGFTDAPGRE
jgi:alpha-ketoglutarate-dependent taurine dioxygenase